MSDTNRQQDLLKTALLKTAWRGIPLFRDKFKHNRSPRPLC